jgi:hypothetical protein
MASKGNKHKYAYDVEEETDEVSPKKQKTIGNDNNDDDDNDSFSSTDDFSLEPKEEVSSDEEEMNLIFSIVEWIIFYLCLKKYIV